MLTWSQDPTGISVGGSCHRVAPSEYFCAVMSALCIVNPACGDADLNTIWGSFLDVHGNRQVLLGHNVVSLESHVSDLDHTIVGMCDRS
jgi:hypothetical protein